MQDGAQPLKPKTPARRAVHIAQRQLQEAYRDSSYRVVYQSDRARTYQSDRGFRTKVIVDKCLAHMVFGDNCAEAAPRLLRR